MNGKLEIIKLEELNLDIKNPRLPLSFQKQELDEKKIINWMLQDASIIELMLAIGQNGFFLGESLLVVQENGKYIVVEGNRRLTSLKLLINPSLAEIHTKKIDKVLEETKNRPTEIPCILFDNRNEIIQYLGYRHVTGIKSWGMLEKARYLNGLLSTLESKTTDEQARELAKKIGSRSDYVKRVLVSYEIFKIVQDNGFYKIPKLDDTTIHFNYFADSLRHENIKAFIGINLDSTNPIEKISYINLEKLTNLFFRKNDQNRSRVLGDSDNLTKLNKILSNDEITQKFLDGLSLDEAFSLIEVDSDTFHNELIDSLRSLKRANSYIHQIHSHNSSDIETLKEIVELCKIIRNSIQNKNDEWDI